MYFLCQRALRPLKRLDASWVKRMLVGIRRFQTWRLECGTGGGDKVWYLPTASEVAQSLAVSSSRGPTAAAGAAAPAPAPPQARFCPSDNAAIGLVLMRDLNEKAEYVAAIALLLQLDPRRRG